MTKVSNLFLNKSSDPTALKAQRNNGSSDAVVVDENLFVKDENGKEVDVSKIINNAKTEVSSDSFSISAFTDASEAVSTAMSDVSKITSKSDDTTALSLSQEIVNYQSSLANQRALMEGVASKASDIDNKFDDISSRYSELSLGLSDWNTELTKIQDEMKKDKNNDSKQKTLNRKYKDVEKQQKQAEREVKKYARQAKVEAENLKSQKQQLAAEAKQYQTQADRIANKANQASAKAKASNIAEDNEKEIKHEDIASRIVNNEIVDETMANGIINKLGDDADFIDTNQLTGVSYDTARDMASEMVKAHKDYSGNNEEAQTDASTVTGNQTAKDSFLDEFSQTETQSADNYEMLSVNEKYDYSSMMNVADKLNNNEYVDTDETNRAAEIAKLISGKSLTEEDYDDSTNPFKDTDVEFEAQKVA